MEKKQALKTFALVFSQCCDPKTAAVACGYKPDEALSAGLSLLSKPYVRRLIEKSFRDRQRLYDCVRAGLEKIAFGQCNDAVKLAFTETESVTPKLIDTLDLSLVSAIKRDKDGGVDLKLFDRQKALEALYELDRSGSGENAAMSFLKALDGDGEAE